MLKKVFLLLPLVFLMIIDLHPTTMHVFIGADTLTKVKSSSKFDIKNITAFAKEIAHQTDMKLKLTIREGKQLNPKSVRKWLKGLTCSPNDVVFFYFTGHGFRLHNTKSRWPWLVFASTKETCKMKDYIDIVKAIPARLKIIFCDCCNNNLRRGVVGLQKSPKSDPNEEDHLFTVKSSLKDAYKKLFLYSRGTVVASGATPGRSAWTTKSGGLFTLAFLKSLLRETYTKDPCWLRLLDRASLFCNIIQKPQYDVTISKIDPLQPLTPPLKPINPPLKPIHPPLQPVKPQENKPRFPFISNLFKKT